MPNKKMIVIFLSLALFVTVARVEAQERRYSLGFSVGLSYWPSEVFKFMEFRPQESYKLHFQRMNVLEESIELNTQYNINFQYDFNPRLAIQAEIEHQEADYWVYLSLFPKMGGKAAYPQHQLSWSITSLFFYLVYMAGESEDKIIPYGFGGLGLCFVQGEEEITQNYYIIDIPSTVDLGFKAGAGLTFNLLPRNIPVGFDLKSFIQALGPRIGVYASSYYGSDIEIGGWHIIWGVELGLKYRF